MLTVAVDPPPKEILPVVIRPVPISASVALPATVVCGVFRKGPSRVNDVAVVPSPICTEPLDNRLAAKAP
jgi:hypothetical protein